MKDVCERIEAAALEQGLPPGFLARLIWKESRFDPNAISPAGAEGIAQFMPYTAVRWGLKNAFEPMQAIGASARLLASLKRGYGNLGLAAAAYNAGEKRVDGWKGGSSGLPRETRDYVYSITGHPAGAWTGKQVPEVDFGLDATRPFQEACRDFNVHRAPLQKRFANTYFNRGLRLAAKKEYAEAIIRYSVAIRLKPTFADAYNNRGIVYRKLGEFEKAVANYDAAIRLKPGYAAAYNNRGYAKRKLGRFEEAVADYSAAIRLRPGYQTAVFNRGFAYAQLGRYTEAVADYTAVLKGQPDHALAYYNRAVTYLELGQFAQARADFDQAISVNSGFAKAYFRRAALWRHLGEAERARADYRKSVALNTAFGHERYRRMFD